MIEEEEQFQSSNNCWICEKLVDNEDEKVRDHCHITRKFWGGWGGRGQLIEVVINKKVPVIFDNLRGYDSHLALVSLTNLT